MSNGKTEFESSPTATTASTLSGSADWNSGDCNPMETLRRCAEKMRNEIGRMEQVSFVPKFDSIVSTKEAYIRLRESLNIVPEYSQQDPIPKLYGVPVRLVGSNSLAIIEATDEAARYQRRVLLITIGDEKLETIVLNGPELAVVMRSNMEPEPMLSVFAMPRRHRINW